MGTFRRHVVRVAVIAAEAAPAGLPAPLESVGATLVAINPDPTALAAEAAPRAGEAARSSRV